MKTLKLIVVCAIVGLAPVLAWAGPGSGIAFTEHDFSSSSGGVGLCTFCHTPHRALQTQLLWNHTLSTNTFSWDVASTTAGTTFPTFKGDTYTGPTAKCLSCHDGSVAVGDIAWWDGGKPVFDSSWKIGLTDKHNVGGGGSMKGNHPVAMPYPYLQNPNTYNGVTTGANAELSEWQSNPTPLNIRLFNDNAGFITAGAVATKTGIECSSCHDPHNKASTDDYFLRGTMKGTSTAYICLQCHVK